MFCISLPFFVSMLRSAYLVWLVYHVSLRLSFLRISVSILHFSVYQSMWLCPCPVSSILDVIFYDLYFQKPSVFCLVAVLSYPVFVFWCPALSCLRFCLQVQVACASQDYAYTEVYKHTRFFFALTRQDKTQTRKDREDRHRRTHRRTQRDRDKRRTPFETVIGPRQDKDEDKEKGKY